MPDARARHRLAILISGRGTNMEAIADAAQAPGYPAEIVLVLSNRAGAEGLARAAARGIPAETLPHRDFPTRAAFDEALHARLMAHRVEAIALAGFMRILTAPFIRNWEGRIVNIHPSLLPKYPGLDTHARALAAADSEAGATVHLVTPDLDSGPILAQARVPILPSDTPETLAARVQAAEHALYPEALAAFLRTLTPPPEPRASATG
jgi:formyltetrahydrofolate-dependent phosphoribosylglycinamide formyltransferase